MPDPEIDPDIDVDDVDNLDSAAIAAAMGFSSFGSQAHPNKKRRFNPLADAVIDSPWDNRPPAARPGPPRPPTTSSNAVPVRNTRAPMSLPPVASLPPRPPVAAPQTNADKIGLEFQNGPDNAAPQYMDTSRPIGEVRDHGLAPAEQIGVGMGAPQPGEDAAALYARMQAVVAAGNAKYAVAQTASLRESGQLDGSVLSTCQGGGLQDRHGFRADLAPGGAVAGIGGGIGGGDAFDERPVMVAEPQVPGEKGQGQQDWWTRGYYDPQSNENPWAGLEARLQLPPRSGCWLETGHHKGQLGPGGGGRGPRRFNS